MARFGLIGGTYTSQSPIADCQRTMNWYPETIESQMGSSAMALYPTPGLGVFATINQPVRAVFEINGRCFAVGGQFLYEILPTGSATNLGNVGNDENPAGLCSNGSLGNQLLCYSAGAIFCFYLAASGANPAGTFIGPVGGLQGTPSMLVFCSSYFVALLAGSNKFQVSNLLDGSTWNPLSIQQNETFPENIAAILSAYGFLFVLGQDGHSQVYYNSGVSQFTPFSPISGAYMEEGCGAPYSPVVMDNTAFWIGGRNGKGDIAWRANGYTPMRVSTFAEETAWASYPKKGSDAIGYTYRDQGHTFWQLRFPSANGGRGATWVYDAATQAWHERGTWGLQGYGAHLSTCYAFAFGQHLVGDWSSGKIYSMSINFLTDNGNVIRRWRRSPHLSNELERIFLTKLQIDVEVGLGPMPPFTSGAAPMNQQIGLSGAGKLLVTDQASNQYALSVNSADGSLVTTELTPQGPAGPYPRDPQLLFTISRDGGKTFGVEYALNCGQAGNFRTRVIQRRLGQARDFVFDIVATDPIPWRIIDGFVEGTGFPGQRARLTKQMAQVA
jgi:hypothetical protein